jgi:hypothetical protein
MMTEKDLISKLQQLKQIKPTTTWVALTKTQIFESGVVTKKPTATLTSQNAFLNFFTQKRFAYSFAALLIMLAGAFGLTQYGNFNMQGVAVNKIQASLVEAPAVKSNVDNLKKTSQDLAEVVKKESQAKINSAIAKVNDATKSLATSVKENPTSAKAVALEVQKDSTLLSVVGGSDFKESSTVLYKTIDEQMIADLKKTTLTDDEIKVFKEAQALYEKGKYSEALEKLLFINK